MAYTKFTPTTGRSAARKRWVEHRNLVEETLIAVVSELLGRAVSYSEAKAVAIIRPLIEASMAGNNAASKNLLQQLGLLSAIEDYPAAEDPAPVIVRQIYNRDVLDWLSSDPNEIRRLLDTADWSGAEDLRAYAEEILEKD